MVVYSDELCHHGILGMKWGVRRYQNKDGTLTSAGKKRVKKQNAKAIKEGRVIDTGNDKVVGVRQKNGDVLFVDRQLYRTRGVDFAESKAHEYIKEATANRQKLKNGKKFVDREEQTLVDDMLRTYDKSDPDKNEAMAILREIKKSNK